MQGDGAKLELRPVGQLEGRFRVPAYQRGYRWGAHEVRQLLEDLTKPGEARKPYALQPIVVKALPGGEWELVDGQQRLTTIYLLLRYVALVQSQDVEPPYSLRYDTRPNSEAFLRAPTAKGATDDLDTVHFYRAYQVIEDWFASKGDQQQSIAAALVERLREHVNVIWYAVPAATDDATAVFRRLNVGRIPLTDAELFKAYLFSKEPERAVTLASQWDAIERELGHSELWAFMMGSDRGQRPTRISVLLDVVAGGARGAQRLPFETFEKLRERGELLGGPLAVWKEVVDQHAMLVGWFEQLDLYHHVGFLTACGVSFAELVNEARGCLKSDFRRSLVARIRGLLKLTAARLEELSYGPNTMLCERVLFLMNVLTSQNAGQRYRFDLHAGESWTLEHIHAQHAEGLKTEEEWTNWVREHANALRCLSRLAADLEQRRNGLLVDIGQLPEPMTQPAFQRISSRVSQFFADASGSSDDAMHSISNLALLTGGTNTQLSNGVFAVKRIKLLDLDQRGSFIPPCTRQVFLKYFTGADAHQVHFWSPADREAYFAAIVLRVGDYLEGES